VLGCSVSQEFKNSVAAEIGRLHWQQFSNRQAGRQTDRQKYVPSCSLSRNMPRCQKGPSTCVQKHEHCGAMNEMFARLSLRDRCLVLVFECGQLLGSGETRSVYRHGSKHRWQQPVHPNFPHLKGKTKRGL
jgi:hypothetical protein